MRSQELRNSGKSSRSSSECPKALRHLSCRRTWRCINSPTLRSILRMLQTGCTRPILGLQEGESRYSPPEVVSSEATPVSGDPDMQRICTSHIERQNGSLRQWCKRLTRLTCAFSKKWENLRAAVALHFAYYNFCRIHGSIKATPAMAAGLAASRWTLADLLA